MQIEKVANGYIVKTLTETSVYSTLDECFERALLHFEGLSKHFSGNSYGKVTVERKRNVDPKRNPSGD